VRHQKLHHYKVVQQDCT